MSYDNACKYLAEQYPVEFVRWLLSIEPTEIQVLKTELTLEPIRADSVSFLQTVSSILHLEFQTLAYSNPPIPFRMLDYYTRLKRQYDCAIEQVVIFLQPTTSEVVFTNEYVDTNTRHRYRIIRLWEQEPSLFLSNPALLPLAPLTRSESPQALLEQVASQVARIESNDERRNILGCVEILAGLRFEKDLIRQLFREEIMQESVIYQDIIQKGRQEGRQEGKKQEALALITRQLTRRFGTLEQQIAVQIQGLSISQLEELAEALLDFSNPMDLTNWLAAKS